MTDDPDDLLERRQRSSWRMRPRYDPQPEPSERELDTDLGALIDRRVEAMLTERLRGEREYLLGISPKRWLRLTRWRGVPKGRVKVTNISAPTKLDNCGPSSVRKKPRLKLPSPIFIGLSRR